MLNDPVYLHIRPTLLDTLARFPELRTREQRLRIFKQLPLEWRRRFAEAQPPGTVFVEALLQVCEAHDCGLLYLYSLVIRDAAPVHIKAMDRILQRLQPLHVECSHLLTLWRLVRLATLSEGELDELHCRTVRSHPYITDLPLLPKCGEAELRLLRFLVRLAGYTPDVDQVPSPLQTFVALMADQPTLRADIRAALESWYHKVCAEPSWEQARHAAAAPVVGGTIHLMVALVPRTGAPERVLVRAWMIEGGHARNLFDPLLEEEIGTAKDLKQLAPLFERLLRSINWRLRCGQPRLIVEVFLSYADLQLAVECVELNDEWFHDYLGALYPVVVRSLERARDRGPAPWLDRRPKLWPGQRIGSDDICREFIHGERVRPADIKYRGRDALAVLLPFRPAVSVSRSACMLWSLLEAGTPIAIWSRETVEEPEVLQRRLFELLAGEEADAPPWQLARRREAVYKEIAGFCKGERFLTVLWDDPNRLPPEQQFHAPPVVDV